MARCEMLRELMESRLRAAWGWAKRAAALKDSHLANRAVQDRATHRLSDQVPKQCETLDQRRGPDGRSQATCTGTLLHNRDTIGACLAPPCHIRSKVCANMELSTPGITCLQAHAKHLLVLPTLPGCLLPWFPGRLCLRPEIWKSSLQE